MLWKTQVLRIITMGESLTFVQIYFANYKSLYEKSLHFQPLREEDTRMHQSLEGLNSIET